MTRLIAFIFLLATCFTAISAQDRANRDVNSTLLDANTGVEEAFDFVAFGSVVMALIFLPAAACIWCFCVRKEIDNQQQVVLKPPTSKQHPDTLPDAPAIQAQPVVTPYQLQQQTGTDPELQSRMSCV